MVSANPALHAFYRAIGMNPKEPFDLMRRNEAAPPEEISRQQRLLLDAQLARAAAAVPYYHTRGFAARIDDFPVQRKEFLDRHFDELIVAGARQPGDKLASGSGTSRIATRMLIDKRSYSWHIAVRWRIAAWHACLPGSRSVLFAQERRKAPLRHLKERIGENCIGRFRLQMLRQDESSVRQLHARLSRLQPQVVDGMTSILESFVLFCQQLGLPAPASIRLVRPSGENISQRQRELFADYFKAPVRATYGAREFGTVAGECREGRYHLSPEINYYEVLREDGSIGPFGSGRILITTLHNQVMPLIRYDPGDIVTLSDEACPCGLPLPVLQEIYGRSSELITLPNGSTVSSRAMYLIFEYLNLHTWRVTQDAPDHLEVLLQPTALWNAADEAHIRTSLQHVLGGQARYDLRLVEQIESLPNGKNPKVVNLTDRRY